VFNLLNVPIGTIIGIYSLIVLLAQEANDVFTDVHIKTA